MGPAAGPAQSMPQRKWSALSDTEPGADAPVLRPVICTRTGGGDSVCSASDEHPFGPSHVCSRLQTLRIRFASQLTRLGTQVPAGDAGRPTLLSNHLVNSGLEGQAVSFSVSLFHGAPKLLVEKHHRRHTNWGQKRLCLLMKYRASPGLVKAHIISKSAHFNRIRTSGRHVGRALSLLRVDLRAANRYLVCAPGEAWRPPVPAQLWSLKDVIAEA